MSTTAQTEDLAEANRLNASVVKLFGEGKYDEALPSAKRVLEIREKALPPESVQVSDALVNLAELYLAKKKYRDAESLYQRLLDSYEKRLGPDNINIVPAVNRLAVLNYMNWDYSKTEKLYKRALSLREKAFGPNHADVAQSLYNLAEFYRFRSDYNKAEPLYQRSLSIRDKLFEPGHSDVKKTVERYRCLFYETNQKDKIEALAKARAELNAPVADDGPRGSVVNGKAISLPKPSVPEEARRARAAGVVVIQVTVDETGKVVAASDVCGAFAPLAKASTEAAYRATFTPTMLGGWPVKVTGVIVYRFVPM